MGDLASRGPAFSPGNNSLDPRAATSVVRRGAFWSTTGPADPLSKLNFHYLHMGLLGNG